MISEIKTSAAPKFSGTSNISLGLINLIRNPAEIKAVHPTVLTKQKNRRQTDKTLKISQSLP